MLESRIKLDIETLTMKLKLIFALLLLSSLPFIAEEVADPCLKAADYKGCKEYKQQQAPGKVNVDTTKNKGALWEIHHIYWNNTERI